jgi:two-component system CheB/CheR fusion protein
VPGEDARSVGRILVVDGDLAVREMLQTLLESVGHRTASASDGRKALDLAADEAIRPDLLIAGYKLPNGFNGLQVVGTLREALHRPIPAIILTSDASADTARDIARRGFIHLNKPVKAAELLGLTQTLLAAQRSAVSSNIRSRAESDNGTLSPTIFVIDDDSSVREVIREGLEAAGKPVADYASCEAFLEVYRPGREGCLVVDANMPGMSGLELLRRLKGTSDQLPAIVITGSGDVGIAVQAMKAGAVDFIEKPVGGAELLASIERALEHTRDSAKLSAWREIAASRIARLTARQRQIMELVLAGHPSKNIAADLGISQRTVENHRAAVMKTTGSKSLPALIRLALAVH